MANRVLTAIVDALTTINVWSFVGLTAAGLVGVAAAVPGQLENMEVDKTDVSLPRVILVALVSNGWLVVAAVLIGLTLGRHAGFVLAVDPVANPSWVVIAPVSGVLVAGTLLVLDRYVFHGLGVEDQQTIFHRLIGSLYGGITEELLVRFGLLSLLVYGGWRLLTPTTSEPSALVVWAAIVLVAVIFGLAHLPATAGFTDLTPSVVTRAIVLNGLAGVVFGWLFWQFGLVAAMVSHFTTDVVIHGILPAVREASDDERATDPATSRPAESTPNDRNGGTASDAQPSAELTGQTTDPVDETGDPR